MIGDRIAEEQRGHRHDRAEQQRVPQHAEVEAVGEEPGVVRSRWKPLLIVFILSPLLVGIVIRCYGWMILLADRGLINATLLERGWIQHTAAPDVQPVRRRDRARARLPAIHGAVAHRCAEADRQILSVFDWPFGAANAFVLLVLSVALIAVYIKVTERALRGIV